MRHKKTRLNWAKEKRSWTVEEWQNVVWSDETALTLIQEGREYTWLKKGEDILDDKFVQEIWGRKTDDLGMHDIQGYGPCMQN